MRRTLIAVALLTWVASAGASVQLFYTSAQYGLTDPNYAFIPTNGNHTDIDDGNWLVNEFPPGMPTSTPVVAPMESVYVWLRFNDEPNGKVINGIDLDASDGNPVAACWYLLDDTLGSTQSKRWDGTPVFQRPQQALVAITSDGLINTNADHLNKLYRGGAYRTALLGAVVFPEDGFYTLQLGTAGIAYRNTPPSEWPTVEFGSVWVITPEPACVALLACVGACVRRR